MPADPLVSAIVGSIVGSVIDGALVPPPPPAMGIIRMLPDASKKGEMAPPWKGQVQIDGKTYLLSPAAQIRNELNMVIFPGMVQRPVKVRYQTDHSGAVHRVWILSSAEAALP
jgi:hypothetical protein